VIGRLICSEWEAKDDTKRSKHSVIGRDAFGSDDDPTATIAVGEARTDE
jgi:hypothetical protein